MDGLTRHTSSPTKRELRLASEFAEQYRLCGFNPLPSRMDAKRPLIKFAHLWHGPQVSKDEFDSFETTNIQVMTGRYWGLLVVDLDGESAKHWWHETAGALPKTWITHSGGDGLHIWFRVPKTWSKPLPKIVMWRGNGKHEAAERLCDRSLVMAPPSIHPKTGEMYKFVARHSIVNIDWPAPCPRWILEAKSVDKPKIDASLISKQVKQVNVARVFGGPRHTRREIVEAIRDVPSLVKSWGLRVSGNPNERGWVPVRAFDRPDAHPSAAIHVDSGYYVDLGSGARMSLFDLSVTLGVYADRDSAIQDLGERYLG